MMPLTMSINALGLLVCSVVPARKAYERIYMRS
jgi:hypothetical protein